MKVLYSLYMTPAGEGLQPYQQVASSGASLDGGIAVHYGRYLGEISGSKAQIEGAIQACGIYSMVAISEEEAQLFLSSGSVPTVNTGSL